MLPSERELQILSVLWERGPSTVREVHERLPGGEAVEYNTVGKLLQIMQEKGLVQRDERQRAHRYRAAVRREQTQRRLLRDLLDRVFEGSAAGMLRALQDDDISAGELREIREIVEELER